MKAALVLKTVCPSPVSLQSARGPSEKKSSVVQSETVTSAAVFPSALPGELSADATALVAEMCDLQLLAHGTDLSLNSQQWLAFGEVVLRTQAVRQTYEAQIATAKAIAPGQYRVEIPTYANAGDVLRNEFNLELRTELGEAMASEVLAKLGDRLEARFAGFGVSAQTLEIRANPGAALTDIQVTRAVTYWNRADDSDRLHTRRETHFPAVEDPTGDSWSALLAMVKA